jgi:hypothetical protein
MPIGIATSADHRSDRRNAGVNRDRSLEIRANAGKITYEMPAMSSEYGVVTIRFEYWS